MITQGEAWKLLGSDPQYEPKRPNNPATGFILHRLNRKGLLRARSDASTEDSGARAYQQTPVTSST